MRNKNISRHDFIKVLVLKITNLIPSVKQYITLEMRFENNVNVRPDQQKRKVLFQFLSRQPLQTLKHFNMKLFFERIECKIEQLELQMLFDSNNKLPESAMLFTCHGMQYKWWSSPLLGKQQNFCTIFAWNCSEIHRVLFLMEN